MEAGVQPRVSAREAYPRHAEHNTVAEGGNRGWAETARQIEGPEGPSKPFRRPNSGFLISGRAILNLAASGPSLGFLISRADSVPAKIVPSKQTRALHHRRRCAHASRNWYRL